MFITQAKVETQMRFGELTRIVERSVNKALVMGATITLNEIVAAETRRGNDPRGPGPHFKKPNVAGPSHLQDSFRASVIRAFGARFGYGTIVVWTENPNAVWQELGTKGRRRKRLKSGDSPYAKRRAGGLESFGAHPGVTPLYFMRKGFARAEPQVVALIQAALSGVGEMGTPMASFDTVTPTLGEFYGHHEI